MFCVKCGFKLGSESLFCPRCGTKVDRKQDEPNSGKSGPLEPVHKQGAGSDVVRHNVDNNDKAYNDELFGIYERLVGPLQIYEKFTKDLIDCTSKLRVCQSKSFIVKPPIIPALKFVGGYGLVFFVLMFFIKAFEANEPAWFEIPFAPFYWVDRLTTIEGLQQFMHKLFPGGYTTNAFTFIGFWIFVLFVPGIIAVLIPCLIAGLVRLAYRRICIPKLKARIESDNMSIGIFMENCSEAMGLVPGDYRYSYALAYFVKAYRNGQATNLKEAIREFEHHLEMKGIRDEIVNSREQIVAELRQIQYNQNAMREELRRVNSSLNNLKWEAAKTNAQLFWD